MTRGAVFVLGTDQSLTELQLSPFLKEGDLQSLLEKHPKLLAGEQINPEAPRKWILVRREQVIPSSDKTDPASWRVDHLFLDQDGIPTLVEVKRQGNSDLRRKVVGQMLDYAANFATYWDARDLRSLFENRYKDDSEGRLAELIGKDKDPDEYWLRVETNLEAGRIRLLFVADVIPAELRRIVEFLNAQMASAEVLAVELRQYGGNDLTTIVPTVYGQTERATARKKVLSQNGPNYRGKESYDGIKSLCVSEGDRIQVGFGGGEKELKKYSVADLRNRRYIWDTTEDPILPKIPGNWIPGDTFMDIVREREKSDPATSPVVTA